MATSNTTLDAIVGELALLEGRRQSDLAHITVLTPPRRAHADRRDETLFAFLDLDSGGTGVLARAMLEKLSQVYWHAGGPVTSALRQAISAANDHMLEENRLLAAGQRREGGLVCAVLREDNLYLAQIGPSQALLAHGAHITRIPTEPPEDATLLTPPTRLPLGVSRGLDINFSHSYLSVGDRLLLTGESWRREVPAEALTHALEAGGGAQDIMRALEQKADQATFSALIIEWASGAETAEPVETVPPVTGTPAPETEMRVALWEDEVSPEQEVVPPNHEDGGRRFPNPLRGVTLPKEQLDQARQVGTALGSGLRTLLTRVLPEPEPEPPPRLQRRRRVSAENVPVMIAIAVAIPLLVAFVVVTFYLQRSDSARREGLMRQAQEAIETARQADGSATRERWGEALKAAQEALDASPDDAEVLAMRNEARDTLNALDRVFYPQLSLLWDYGPGKGRRLATARLQVYVLDAEQDQVTQHTLDQARQSATEDQLTLVVYRGERVGDAEVGELLDVVWLEAGGGWGRDILLILTEDHQILQYNLSWGVSWVPFDIGLAQVNGQVMQPFDGKLYVLDPEHSQVWRFPTTGEGFGPPEGYFAAAAPDLSAAVDMVIDGAVYILLEDGHIYKFFGGETQPFEPAGLPQPLGDPVALAVEGDAAGGALYVADAQARSIVALDKNGQFIHQIKADGDAWAGLEALAIEEHSRTLYTLATGRLYALPLPSLPESE